MTIDAPTAGLLAQVIPVLLVFLALEDRLRPRKIGRSRRAQWIRTTRELSVVMSLISLFLCLWIVVTKAESGLMSFFVILTMILVLVTLFALFAIMFGREAKRLRGQS